MIIRAYDMCVDTLENLHSGNGTIYKKDITSNMRPDNIKMFSKLIINEGCSIGLHKHDTDSEIFYILRGIGEYFDGREKFKLTVGDSAVARKGDSHSIVNISDEPLELIAAIVLQ